MSITFHLTSTKTGELQSQYPDEERKLSDIYPNLDGYFEDMSDTDHVYAGHFFTHDKGWCLTISTIPEVNMSNANAHYVLNDILNLNTQEYCGDIIDLREAKNLCILNTHPNCYYAIPELKKLLSLALDNNWGVYWA